MACLNIIQFQIHTTSALYLISLNISLLKNNNIYNYGFSLAFNLFENPLIVLLLLPP